MLISLATCLLSVGIDSSFFQVKEQEFNKENDAIRIVQSFVQKNCSNNIAIQNSHCKNIIGNDDATKVCYISTNVGYFFVMKDMMENVNVIYNRWD